MTEPTIVSRCCPTCDQLSAQNARLLAALDAAATVARTRKGYPTDASVAIEKLRADAVGPLDPNPRFVVDGEDEYILDDDFGYDACLRLSGDFVDDHRRRYAEAVAAALNLVPPPKAPEDYK